MPAFSDFSAAVTRYSALGFSLDLSRMDIPRAWVDSMQPAIDKAFADLAALEAGAIANPDEGRMVGHYWLRNPSLAPTPELRDAITAPIAALKKFAGDVASGAVSAPGGGKFEQILLIGIGGSALGPQLVSAALGRDARLPLYFFDNTDPAGMDAVLGQLRAKGLGKTLALVISKSGGTPETRTGMLEATAA